MAGPLRAQEPGPSAAKDEAAARRGLLAEADRLDQAIYGAIAAADTPRLDVAMRRLSAAANWSRLSMLAAALLAATCGRRGRRAAASGLAAVAVTSFVGNVIVKPVGRRRRPDRDAAGSAPERAVKMPGSRSFPSGHSAAAVAFASAASRELPEASAPLHVLAALVGYSRIHTGVHYPGDVLAGAVLGEVIADSLAAAAPRLRRARDARRGSTRRVAHRG